MILTTSREKILSLLSLSPDTVCEYRTNRQQLQQHQQPPHYAGHTQSSTEHRHRTDEHGRHRYQADREPRDRDQERDREPREVRDKDGREPRTNGYSHRERGSERWNPQQGAMGNFGSSAGDRDRDTKRDGDSNGPVGPVGPGGVGGRGFRRDRENGNGPTEARESDVPRQRVERNWATARDPGRES
jgi:hypothetical protein